MFADTLNPIIAKKNMKENYKIKKYYFFKETITKYRLLQTKEILQN